MAAAGLSGPTKQHDTIKPHGKVADTQAGFKRFLATQKTDVQDKTGIGWGTTANEVHTDDGWGPDSAGVKTSQLSTHKMFKPPVALIVPPLHQSFVPQVVNPKLLQPEVPHVEQSWIAQESKPLPSQNREDFFTPRNWVPQEYKPKPSQNRPPHVEQHRSSGRSRPQGSQGGASGIQQTRVMPEGSKPKTSQRVGSTYQMERVPAPQIDMLAPNLVSKPAVFASAVSMASD